jgi:multidrug efflux pump subunit AcrA (membrane-fusion protein)
VRLRTGSFQNALLLPRRGVLTEDGESYVFVAQGDSVNKVGITLGAVENDTAQIIGGLKAGDSVVTVGQGGLKPGAKIKAVTL